MGKFREFLKNREKKFIYVVKANMQVTEQMVCTSARETENMHSSAFLCTLLKNILFLVLFVSRGFLRSHYVLDTVDTPQTS